MGIQGSCIGSRHPSKAVPDPSCGHSDASGVIIKSAVHSRPEGQIAVLGSQP